MSGLPSDTVHTDTPDATAAAEAGNANITQAVAPADATEVPKDPSTVAPADPAPAVVETAEPTTTSGVAPVTEAAQTTTEGAPTTNVADEVVAAAGATGAAAATTEGEAAKDSDAAATEEKEPEPIEEGQVGLRTTFLPFIYQNRHLWFQDEPVAAENLSEYLKKEKNHKTAHANHSFATQTGKGLLFIAKTAADKAKPIAIFRLDGAEVNEHGSDKFDLKSTSGELHMEASSPAVRKQWVHTLKAKIAEANEHAPAVVESEGYKSALEKFTAKATPVVVKKEEGESSKAVEEAKKEEDKEEKKEEKDKKKKEKKERKEKKKKEVTEGAAAAEAADSSSSSSSDSEDEAADKDKKEKKKSRFSFLGGKKEKKEEEKKKEEAIPEATAAEGAVAADATTAEAAAAPESEVAPAPAPGIVTTQPEANAGEEVKTDETPKEQPSPSPKASNRRSFFGSLPFGRKKEEEKEKKEVKEEDDKKAEAGAAAVSAAAVAGTSDAAAAPTTEEAAATTTETPAEAPKDATTETPAEAAKDEHKERKSSFANLLHFGRKKDEKKAEHETKDEQKEGEASKDEAPVLAPVDLPSASEGAEATPATEAAAAPETVAPVEATKDETPADTTAAATEEKKDDTPSSPPKTSFLHKLKPAKKEKEEPKSDSEGAPEKEKLSRRFSQMWKGKDKKAAATKEEATPATEGETKDTPQETGFEAPKVDEPVMIPDTAAADSSETPAVGQIGDVVPAAITAGEPVKTNA